MIKHVKRDYSKPVQSDDCPYKSESHRLNGLRIICECEETRWDTTNSSSKRISCLSWWNFKLGWWAHGRGTILNEADGMLRHTLRQFSTNLKATDRFGAWSSSCKQQNLSAFHHHFIPYPFTIATSNDFTLYSLALTLIISLGLATGIPKDSPSAFIPTIPVLQFFSCLCT